MNVLSKKEIYLFKFSGFWFSGTLTLKLIQNMPIEWKGGCILHDPCILHDHYRSHYSHKNYETLCFLQSHMTFVYLQRNIIDNNKASSVPPFSFSVVNPLQKTNKGILFSFVQSIGRVQFDIRGNIATIFLLNQNACCALNDVNTNKRQILEIKDPHSTIPATWHYTADISYLWLLFIWDKIKSESVLISWN